MDFSHLTSYIELASAAVIGGIAVFGVFNTTQRSRRKEDDTVSQNLIRNLQTTADIQEKEITQLRADKIEQGQQIAHLQGQLKTFTEVFQGRDPALQAFLNGNPLGQIEGLTRSIETLVRTLTPKT